MLVPDSATLHPGYVTDVARMERSGIRGLSHMRRATPKCAKIAPARRVARRRAPAALQHLNIEATQPCALRLASAL